MFLITGGLGFIGSHLAETLLQVGHGVVNVDARTYAASPRTQELLDGYERHHLITGLVTDKSLLTSLFERFQPEAIFHLAAESHVDRSISGPSAFVETNIVGTEALLESALEYWQALEDEHKKSFRFIHVSTDEVFGQLRAEDPPFTISSPYRPRSPYSASKAASDHLVEAFHATYGLPVLITHSSNNYGQRQHPEKFIPTIVRCALAGEPIPIYGSGQQRRDWIHVSDHVAGLLAAAESAAPGERYLFGADEEWSNADLARLICSHLDELRPREDESSYADQISFVEDRPGHDFRYAVDSSASQTKLGWKARADFPSQLKDTIQWLIDQPDWHLGKADRVKRLCRTRFDWEPS